MESFVTRVRGTEEDRARLVLAAARRRVRVPDLIRQALESTLAEADRVPDSFFADEYASEHTESPEALHGKG